MKRQIKADTDNSYEQSKKMLFRFLEGQGYDVTAEDVVNEVEAVCNMYDFASDPTYTIADWYKDTVTNYPEELEELTRTTSE